jgi:hypothetical protein
MTPNGKKLDALKRETRQNDRIGHEVEWNAMT